MVDGRWSMVDGRWSTVDGRRSLVDGRWSTVDGRWSMVDGRALPFTSPPLYRQRRSASCRTLRDMEWGARVRAFVVVALVTAGGCGGTTTVPCASVPPGVACGASTCGGATPVCCTEQTTCVAASGCGGYDRGLSCDDPSDCAPGEVCCYHANKGSFGSACASPSACVSNSYDFIGPLRLCWANCDCPIGSQCVSSSTGSGGGYGSLPPWAKICQ
jgi:hypothetical protein